MSSGKIIRVFPRRTAATPDDELAFVGQPPMQFVRPIRAEVERVDISVCFTWDIEEGHRLRKVWSEFYDDVRIGGPAFGDRGGEFEPGRYLARGYTITSRGCPRNCDFCLVPNREGGIRTLAVRDGWNVLDNNLLACGKTHFAAVAEMLDRQPRGAEFTGGIDVRLLTPWHIAILRELRIRSIFVAYDIPETAPIVADAVGSIRATGLNRRRLSCYVLVGREGDTIPAAEKRCLNVWKWGAVPFAMYYRPPTARKKQTPPDWAAFVRRWTRRQEIYSRMKGAGL